MSMKIVVGLLAFALACKSETQSGAETQRSQSNGTHAGDSSIAGARGDKSTRAPGKVTVLFFGTSLTAGYGLEDPDKAFPGVVAAQSVKDGDPVEAVNAGLSGETSAGAVRRIDWALKRPVDVVVVETGGNDALRALDPDSLEANLRAIVARVRLVQPKAEIVIAGMQAPPNLGARYTTRFSHAYSDVARTDGLTLIPFLLDGVAGKAELNQGDGIHPNERGAAIVGANVWKVLKPIVRRVEGRSSQ